MTTPIIRSAYLAKPHITHRHRWAGFSTTNVVIRRAQPHLIWRTLMSLLVWCIAAGTFTYISEHPGANSQTTTVVARNAVTSPAQTTSHPLAISSDTAATPAPIAKPAAPVQLASVQKTTSLATDPTGQILPPIYMAPAYTYNNNYDWGQCTWYVAGRRQVPSSWGNAISWYYRAQADGWSVGATPAVGAIAWTPDGAVGHVALVEQISTDYSEVYISEMNFDGEGIIDHRWVPTNSFKYIY